MPGKSHKVVVLGAKCTGKTAILEQVIYGSHVLGVPLPSTIEDIYTATILTDRSTPEVIRFYDTAALDPQKPSVPKLYYSLADAYILVFDITKWETFHCLNALRADIERNREKRDTPIILVLGNKSDLEQESRQIDTETVTKWAHKERVKFIEVSVTNRKGLMDAFSWLASKLNPAPQRSGLSLKFKKSNSTGGGGVLSSMGPSSDV